MTEAGLRWGIVGPGEIARVFAASLGSAPGLGRVLRVHGRRAEAVGRFCRDYGGEPAEALGDLIADPDVDAVYVATPHPRHAAAVAMALRVGKAVLCEKPLCVELGVMRALYGLAEQHRAPLAEAWMYRAHPQITRLRELLDAGTIGRVMRIESKFGFAAEVADTHRLRAPEHGGGGIFDVGGYPVSAALWVAGTGTHSARVVEAQGRLAPTGVDAWARLELEFATGERAELEVSIDTELGRSLVVHGDAGRIEVEDPFLPGGERRGLQGRLVVEQRRGEAGAAPRVEELVVDSALDCFALEAEMMAELVQTGAIGPSPPFVTHAESMAIHDLLHVWRRAVGATPAFDMEAGSLRSLG